MKTLSPAALRQALVPRLPDDHKGTFGHALIVAGSSGMAGAAILATRACLRSGSGLVTLALPASLQPFVAPHVPEAMTIPLPDTAGGVLKPQAAGRLAEACKAGRYTVLALGPGMTTQTDAAKFVLHALSTLPLAAVVDADAINVLAQLQRDGHDVGKLLRARRHPLVVTPHPGEMERCLGVDRSVIQKDRRGHAQRLARDWSSTVVLKGRLTVISDGERAVLNRTGGPGLARGGTGDVLAGLIAGLWAQMLASGRVEGGSGFLAAALGCHLHGWAGDRAEAQLGAHGMTAQDVIDRLPEAFKAL